MSDPRELSTCGESLGNLWKIMFTLESCGKVEWDRWPKCMNVMGFQENYTFSGWKHKHKDFPLQVHNSEMYFIYDAIFRAFYFWFSVRWKQQIRVERRDLKDFERFVMIPLNIWWKRKLSVKAWIWGSIREICSPFPLVIQNINGEIQAIRSGKVSAETAGKVVPVSGIQIRIWRFPGISPLSLAPSVPDREKGRNWNCLAKVRGIMD